LPKLANLVDSIAVDMAAATDLCRVADYIP
jgi:hypothetical protein